MLKPRSRGLAATRDSNAIQITGASALASGYLAVLFIAQWPGPVAQDRLLYRSYGLSRGELLAKGRMRQFRSAR